jgi:NAD dependent epimerase/dehydratase family enzyme
LAIEKLFSGPQDTVLKCGLIIGNGGIVKQMTDFMRSKHMVPLIGGGRQPLQVVAVSDLVRIIHKVLTKPASGTYVIATPEVYSYREFYAAIARQLGIKVLFVPIPYRLLQAVFRAAAFLHLPLGVGEDNLEGLKMLRSMDSAPGLKKLDIRLQDLPTALAKISNS